jgi:hypothetical protein
MESSPASNVTEPEISNRLIKDGICCQGSTTAHEGSVTAQWHINPAQLSWFRQLKRLDLRSHLTVRIIGHDL